MTCAKRGGADAPTVLAGDLPYPDMNSRASAALSGFSRIMPSWTTTCVWRAERYETLLAVAVAVGGTASGGNVSTPGLRL